MGYQFQKRDLILWCIIILWRIIIFWCIIILWCTIVFWCIIKYLCHNHHDHCLHDHPIGLQYSYHEIQIFECLINFLHFFTLMNNISFHQALNLDDEWWWWWSNLWYWDWWGMTVEAGSGSGTRRFQHLVPAICTFFPTVDPLNHFLIFLMVSHFLVNYTLYHW